ncbi:MAG: hypothetical protein M3N68_13830 [Actinomycetota bacterium]|nr:hypothetical protein [Actinomycetota bacterium]
MSSPRGTTDRRKVLVGGTLATLAAAVILVIFVVRFASQHPEEANLGSSVFRFDAERLAREIDEGGPSLFKDPLTRNPGREVYIQHLGRDAGRGWTAIRAYASEVSLDCLLRWDRERRRFVDPCTERTYPPDGKGLITYPATVNGGTVTVDLRPGARRPG